MPMVTFMYLYIYIYIYSVKKSIHPRHYIGDVTLSQNDLHAWDEIEGPFNLQKRNKENRRKEKACNVIALQPSVTGLTSRPHVPTN